MLDPVMIAKGGAPLLAEEAMGCMRDMLVPLADILTPNLPEAAALLGEAEAENREDMRRQAKALQGLGARNIYLKGGHFTSDESPDLMLTRRLNTGLKAGALIPKTRMAQAVACLHYCGQQGGWCF